MTSRIKYLVIEYTPVAWILITHASPMHDYMYDEYVYVCACRCQVVRMYVYKFIS